MICWSIFLPLICGASDGSDPLQIIIEAMGDTEKPEVQAALLKGVLDGLEGRRNLAAPLGWPELSQKLASSDNTVVRERARSLSQLFGDVDALSQAISLLKNTAADTDDRRATLSMLLNQQNKQASSLLKVLIDQPTMKLDAIRGYAVVENLEASSILLTRYQKLDSQQKRAVIETLASRKVYAKDLIEAIKTKKITRADVPAQVARSLRDLMGDQFTKVFGEVREVEKDRLQQLAEYKRLCNPEAMAKANAARGRAVYNKTCAACHKLYDQGGNVGPELTGSNRANLDYILLNSVDPSYDVPDAYKTVSVLTVDGRSVNGVLAEEDSTRIVLKTPEQPRLVIAKDDIELRKTSDKSMMPEGQLDQMAKQDVIDLIKYLRTTEQVETAK